MESPRQPRSTTTRALPFKRTVKRKISDETTPKSVEKGKDKENTKRNNNSNDDGLSLFSRSRDFFPTVIEDQQKRAQEKAQRSERERLAREHKAEQDALNEQLRREQRESAKKRRRISLCDDDDDDDSDDQDEKRKADDGDDDDDVFSDKPSRQRDSFAMRNRTTTPRTPTSKSRSRLLRGSAQAAPGPSRATRSPKAHKPPVYALSDDSGEDEDDVKPVVLSPAGGRRSLAAKSEKQTAKLEVDSDDNSDPELWMAGATGDEAAAAEDDDPGEMYVRAAMERMAKAKSERLAREQSGDLKSLTPEDNAGPVVSILIHPHLPNLKTTLMQRRLRQSLEVVFKTWVEIQDRHLRSHNIPSPQRAELDDDVLFTWKGNIVFRHTTLQTLGIRPEADGSLYPSWQQRPREGYGDRTQVFFEAWTREAYDEYLRRREREKLRERGELPPAEEEEQQPETRRGGMADEAEDEEKKKETKIRVIFKAREKQDKKATVRSTTTGAQLVRLYQKLAGLPDTSRVELHWDGEVLEPDVTVVEAEIGDMDSLEVHVR